MQLNGQNQQQLPEDEGFLQIEHNPLWPSSHTGYLYTPLDLSWRTENNEFFLALYKTSQSLLMFYKEHHKQLNNHQYIQAQNEVQDRVFNQQQGFIQQNEDQKQKQPDRSIPNAQAKILDNLIQILNDYLNNDIQRPGIYQNCCAKNCCFKNADHDFGNVIMYQFNSYIEQKCDAIKNVFSFNTINNKNLLDNLQRVLLNCIENSLRYLKFYQGTTFSNITNSQKRYYFPVIEPYMLRYPILHNYLFFQLHLANILRQNGDLNNAFAIYSNLIILSQNQNNQSQTGIIPQVLANCLLNQTKPQQMSAQQCDFPDVKIPYFLCLLSMGRGQNAMRMLEYGSKQQLSNQPQVFQEQNFCRSQRYFQSYYQDVNYYDENYILNKLPCIEKTQLQQKYQDILAINNYVKGQLRIKCQNACCSFNHECEQQPEDRQSKIDNMINKKKNQNDFYEKEGQNGTSYDTVQTMLNDKKCCNSNMKYQKNDKLQKNNTHQNVDFVEHTEKHQTNFNLYTQDVLPDDICTREDQNIIFSEQQQLLINNRHKQQIQQQFDLQNVDHLINDDTKQNYSNIKHINKQKLYEQSDININSYNTQINTQHSANLFTNSRQNVRRQKTIVEKTLDHSNIIRILQLYQSRENPYIYQSPLSRFILYGQFFNTVKCEVQFGFDYLKQINNQRDEQFSKLIHFEYFENNQNIYTPLTTASMLYSYILLLVNKRVVWSNTIAKIIHKEQLFNQCCCGLASHSLDGNANIAQIAAISKLQCGSLAVDNGATRCFVDAVLEKYPPPKLPCMQLIYLAFQSNPLIAEFLLSFRRLPDICTLRQLFFTFDSNSKQNGHKNNNVHLIQQMSKTQQYSLEAALYTSDFGHFWQADDLSNDITRLANIIQLLNENEKSCTYQIQKLHYYNEAQRLIMNNNDQFMSYAALDFLHLSYLQYLDYQLIKQLKLQIQFNQTYFEQLAQTYTQNVSMQSDQQNQPMNSLQQFQQLQTQIQQQFYAQQQQQLLNLMGSLNNLDEQDSQDQYISNQFNIQEQYLNMQNLQSFKANIYLQMFEKHLHFILQENPQEQQSGCGQVDVIRQRIVLRQLGDLLVVIPDLQAYNIYRELYRLLMRKATPESYLQTFIVQIQKQMGNFESSILKKQEKFQTAKQQKKQEKEAKKSKNTDSQNVVQKPENSQIINQLEQFFINGESVYDIYWNLFKQLPALCISQSLQQMLFQQNIIQNSQFRYIQFMQLSNTPYSQQQDELQFTYQPNQLNIINFINNVLTNNQTQINNFNVTTNLYEFQQQLQSIYQLHFYDMNLFTKDPRFQSLLQIIIYNGLDTYLSIFYQILLANQKYVKKMLQFCCQSNIKLDCQCKNCNPEKFQYQYCCSIKYSNKREYDTMHYFYQNIEKDTGNVKYDKIAQQMNQQYQQVNNIKKAQPNEKHENDVNQVPLTLHKFAHFYSQIPWQQYFKNNQQQIQSVQACVLYAQIPVNFMYVNEYFGTINDNGKQKIERLSYFKQNLDNYIQKDMVQKSSINLFYLAVLSGNSNTLFLIMQNYQYSFNELLQAIFLASSAGLHFQLRLLLNLTQNAVFDEFDELDLFQLEQQKENQNESSKNSILQLLNNNKKAFQVNIDYINQQQSIIQQKYDSIKKKQDENSLAEQLKSLQEMQQLNDLVSIHQLLYNSLNDQNLESSAPLHFKLQQRQKYENFTKKLFAQNNLKPEFKQQEQIFQNEDIIHKNLQIQQEARNFICINQSLQFTLLVSLAMNSTSICQFNECQHCQICKKMNVQFGRNGIDFKNKCAILHQLTINGVNSQIVQQIKLTHTSQVINQHVLNLNAQQLCQTFTTLISVSQFEFFQLYINKVESQQQDKKLNFDNFTDLLEFKIKQQSFLKQEVHLVPLTTPYIVAAQANSEIVPAMCQFMRQSYQCAPQQLQNEIEKFINHQDYLGYTAVQHATVVFLRISQTMIDLQQKYDVFNQMGKEKMQLAKNISVVKILFKQAAANLRNCLELKYLNTFTQDKQKLNIRQKLVVFMLNNKLLTGNLIQLTEQITNSQQEIDNIKQLRIPTELFLLIFVLSNDQLVKQQFEQNKDLNTQQKANFKKYVLNQTNSEQQRMNQKKQKLQQALGQQCSKEDNLFYYLLKQQRSYQCDQLQLGFNMQLHASLFKFNQNEQQQFIQSGELLKTVILEIIEVIRLLYTDEKHQSQGVSIPQIYCQEGVELSKLKLALPGSISTLCTSSTNTGANNFLGFDFSQNSLPEFKQIHQLLTCNSVYQQFPTHVFMHNNYNNTLNNLFNSYASSFKKHTNQEVEAILNINNFQQNNLPIILRFNEILELNEIEKIIKYFKANVSVSSMNTEERQFNVVKNAMYQNSSIFQFQSDATVKQLFQEENNVHNAVINYNFNVQNFNQEQQINPWHELTNEIIQNDQQKLKFLQTINKVKQTDEQVTCMLRNLYRYSYRYFRQFLHNGGNQQYQFNNQHNFDSKVNYSVLTNIQVANLKLQPSFQLEEEQFNYSIPRLASVQSDDQLYEWRRIVTRVHNMSMQQDDFKVCMVRYSESGKVLDLKDCLILNQLSNLINKQQFDNYYQQNNELQYYIKNQQIVKLIEENQIQNEQQNNIQMLHTSPKQKFNVLSLIMHQLSDNNGDLIFSHQKMKDAYDQQSIGAYLAQESVRRDIDIGFRPVVLEE